MNQLYKKNKFCKKKDPSLNILLMKTKKVRFIKKKQIRSIEETKKRLEN